MNDTFISVDFSPSQWRLKGADVLWKSHIKKTFCTHWWHLVVSTEFVGQLSLSGSWTSSNRRRRLRVMCRRMRSAFTAHQDRAKFVSVAVRSGLIEDLFSGAVGLVFAWHLHYPGPLVLLIAHFCRRWSLVFGEWTGWDEINAKPRDLVNLENSRWSSTSIISFHNISNML